jgi:hypothetical protein
MPVEMLTYAALGERLNCSSEAARSLAKRLRLPRQLANDGKALVAVDVAELAHKAMHARSPAGDRPITATLKARVEALHTELAKVEASAAGHRADFEFERERADRFMTELYGRQPIPLQPRSGGPARRRAGGSEAKLSVHHPGGRVGCACWIESEPKPVGCYPWRYPRRVQGLIARAFSAISI